MSESIKTINSNSSNEILENLRKFQRNKNVRAVILSFINESRFEYKVDLIEKIENFPKPIVTKINKQAKGFLFEIILASHICIATENAEFEILNKEKLEKQIGSKNIQKLKQYEHIINSTIALDLAIVNKVVSQNEIEKEALSMAEKISKLAPLAIKSCLQAVNKGLKLELEDGLKLETELFSKIFSTEDMREGTSAFLEKRKPKFQGK